MSPIRMCKLPNQLARLVCRVSASRSPWLHAMLGVGDTVGLAPGNRARAEAVRSNAQVVAEERRALPVRNVPMSDAGPGG
jgi:hypothetical protein